jgi:hypothetical protein
MIALSRMSRQQLSRAAVVLGGLALLWTLIVLWTGGFLIHAGGVRISSRGPRNPALLTLLSLALAWVLAPSGQRNRSWAAECQRLLDIIGRLFPAVSLTRRTAQAVACLAALGVVIVGFVEGAFVVAGSDSYGYVSQAHLWLIGDLRQQPALRRSVPPDIPLEALSPLGYRPSADHTTIAPTYSPGLPMVMAVFERVAGRDSVFWVVPLLATVLVWTTYLVGRRVRGSLVGVVAAVLVATSPPVLFQLTAAPMSDLPAAAWWALAMALAAADRDDAALGAGIASSLAIVTRPNLTPIAVIAGGLLVWRLFAAGSPRWRVIRHVLLFALPVIAACLTIAALNRALWGSVLTSGYGSLASQRLFTIDNVWSNLLLYPRVIATQMPVVLLIPIAIVMRKPLGDGGSGRMMIWALGACAVMCVLLYVAYPPFDSKQTLRFLLPAVVPLLVLASASAVSLAGRLIETQRAACLLALLVVGGYGLNYARDVGAFELGHLRRYAAIGDYITRELPQRAVLLSMLHSGSATYYSGRPTLRWDLLPPSRLDTLVVELEQRGDVPYLLLDADERRDFTARYRGHSRLGALDWPPLVTLKPAEVYIYAIPPQP